MSRYQPCAAYQSIENFLVHDLSRLESIYCMPSGFYSILLAALRQAHTFVFDFAEVEGRISETTAVAQFTADCMTEGIFQPPFDVTLLQWPDPPNGYWRYAAALVLTLRRNGKTTVWGEALQAMTDKFGVNVPDRGCLSASIGFAVQAKEDPRVCYLQDLSVLMSHRSGKRIDVTDGAPRGDWDLSHVAAIDVFNDTIQGAMDSSLRDAGVTVRNLFYYMGVLSSRGPRMRSMTPDPKVVQRRAREGRSPWTSYSLISLPQQGTSAGNGVDGSHRSSPRQHWRRGHIRHLPSGEVIPIEPCIVGASELGKVIASYHVGSEDMARS